MNKTGQQPTIVAHKEINPIWARLLNLAVVLLSICA